MNDTKHIGDCGRGWGRKLNPLCPRCVELMNGAKPRAGWGDRKRMQEAATLKAIRSHIWTQFDVTFDW